MNLALAIVTLDRRSFGLENYVERTWESLVRSGLLDQLGEDRVAFFDAGPGQGFAEYLRRLTGQKVWGGPGYHLDQVRNSHRAMAWLAGTGADFGIYMEDDVVVARNFLLEARQWLARCAPDDGALYSLATPYEFVGERHNQKRRWAPHDVSAYYGQYCLSFPQHVLVGYLISEMRQDAEEVGEGTDMSIKRYLQATKGKIYVHCPNIAGHVGLTSVLGHKHSYTSFPAFPGEDYDALGGHCDNEQAHGQ